MDEISREREDTIDRISALPADILQAIMSSLALKERARTSVLSKTWLRAWHTFPSLDFDQSVFAKRDAYFDTEKFLNFVDQTLSRYQQQKISIQAFRLRVKNKILAAPLVDKWLQFATQIGVKILSLHISPELSYSFPETIFNSKSLIELVICHYNLALGSSIKLPSLRKLSLEKIYLDDHVIQNLISGCPLMEVFDLNFCVGFKNIKVANHEHLKRFRIDYDSLEIERVEIEAPSLESFSYWSPGILNSPCIIDIYATQNLKSLRVSGVSRMTDMILHNLLAESPLLEDLVLYNCNLLESIYVSSASLKNFFLYSCYKVIEINIDAPNLLSLCYYGDEMPIYFTNTPSKLLKTKLDIIPNPYFQIPFFLWLREFLANVYQSQVSIKIVGNLRKNDVNFEHLRGMFPYPPEHEVEELRLSSLLPPTLLDALFVTFHPKYIYVDMGDLLKFLHQTLIMDRKNSECCRCHRIKCWRHYLINAEYEYREVIWKPHHYDSSADESLFFDEWMSLRLKLTWL